MAIHLKGSLITSNRKTRYVGSIYTQVVMRRRGKWRNHLAPIVLYSSYCIFFCISLSIPYFAQEESFTSIELTKGMEVNAEF